MYEKLPETIRVNLTNLLDLYVLVVPNIRYTHDTQYREFFLVNDTTGKTEYMFGCAVESDEHAAELAAKNAPLYATYETGEKAVEE